MKNQKSDERIYQRERRKIQAEDKKNINEGLSLTVTFFLVSFLPAVVIAFFYFLSFGGFFDLSEGNRTALETGFKTPLILAFVVFFVTLLNGRSEMLPLTSIVATSLAASWSIFNSAPLLLLALATLTLILSILTAHFLTEHRPRSGVKTYWFVLAATICGFLVNTAVGFVLAF